MINVHTFDEAIVDSAQFSKRHLLIGNGFSIACYPDIFHYGSLFSKADFSANPKLLKVFDVLDTQDFEIAIHNLESGAKFVPIYVSSMVSAAEEMLADASALKEILLSTISGNHPNVPVEISDTKF